MSVSSSHYCNPAQSLASAISNEVNSITGKRRDVFLLTAIAPAMISGCCCSINLASREISGTLPPLWGSMNALKALNLADNNLSGNLPPEWSSMSALRDFDLGGNSLSGNLPPKWSSMSALQDFDLGGNSLSGNLPPEWSLMSALRALNLSGNNLTGMLPPEWGSMHALVHLNLSGNSLSGPLPPQWSSMTALMELNLAGNNLSGPLPPQWSSLRTLERLDLMGNTLSGSIPPSWGWLQGLRTVKMSNNHLNGTLPPELGSLTGLNELDVSCNQLSGELPELWANIPQLTHADLSCQRGPPGGFRGSMPSSWRSLCHVSYGDITWCRAQEACVQQCNNTNVDTSVYQRQDSCPIPMGIQRLYSNQSAWDWLKTNWKDDGCRYQYAYEALLGLMVVLPFSFVCMLVAGLLLRKRGLRDSVSRQCSGGEAAEQNGWLHQSMRYVKRVARMVQHSWILPYVLLLHNLARPGFVITDVVMDAVTIAQVWGSWVGYVMLMVVFVPNLVTTTVLAVCMFRCGWSMFVKQASSTVFQGVLPQGVSMPCERLQHVPIYWHYLRHYRSLTLSGVGYWIEMFCMKTV